MRQAFTLIGLAGLLGISTTAMANHGHEAKHPPSAARSALEARVQAVRTAIQPGQHEPTAQQDKPPGLRLAQWYNWGNWGNWNNWRNWGNWGNF